MRSLLPSFTPACTLTDEDTVVSLMKCGGYALTMQLQGPISVPVKAIEWWQEMFELPEAYQAVISRPVEVIADDTLAECRRMAFKDMRLPTTEQEFNRLVVSYISASAIGNNVLTTLSCHLQVLSLLFYEVVHGRNSEMVLLGLGQLANIAPLVWKLDILYYSMLLLKPAVSSQFAWDVCAWCNNAWNFFSDVRTCCLVESRVVVTFVRDRLGNLLTLLQLLGNAAIDMRREWLMPKNTIDTRK
jgi:hypothetical protein